MAKRFLLIALAILLVSGSMSVCAEEGSGGNTKIKRLVSQLYDKRHAMDARRQLSSYGKETTPYVLPLLKDKNNESVRIAALNIIAATADTSAEDEVAKRLSDGNNRVRKAAARALSVIGGKESSIEPLKNLLQDHFPEVRYNAIKALAKIAPKSEVELFVFALRDYDPRIRKAAVIALGKIKNPDSVPYLLQAARDFDPGVRLETGKTLVAIGNDACLQPMVWLTGDPDVIVRMFAVTELARMNVAGVEEHLVKIANSSDSRVASRAITALAEKKSSKALEVARDHLGDEHMEVRLAAIEVVGDMGSKSDKALLNQLLEAESMLVREKAGEAILKVDART